MSGLHRWAMPWTANETATLRRLHAAGLPAEEIAAQLGRTRSGIVNRVIVLDLHRPRRGREYSTADDRELERRLVAGESYAAIAAALGRTRASIGARARRLGLYSRATGYFGGVTTRRWSASDKRQLLDGIARGQPIARVAARLGRTTRAAEHQARKLGLYRADWTTPGHRSASR